MSRFTPIRLATFAILLLTLTFVAIRAERGGEESTQSVPETSMILSEITVPVEIIQTGQDPAVVKILVQP